MLSNRLRGTWDRLIGFNRELWGELTGDKATFEAGRHQRLIGWLECDRDLKRQEAIRKAYEITH